MDDEKVDEKDIENVLKILENFSGTETSRLKIQVSEEKAPEKVEKAYHHGRCDVGSPWAAPRGTLWESAHGEKGTC